MYTYRCIRTAPIYCIHVKQTKVYQNSILKMLVEFQTRSDIDEQKRTESIYCFIQFGKFQMIMPMIVEQQSQEFRLLLSKLRYKPIEIPIVYSNYFLFFSLFVFFFLFLDVDSNPVFFHHNIYKIMQTHHHFEFENDLFFRKRNEKFKLFSKKKIPLRKTIIN